MTPCECDLIIESQPHSGSWNMATDEFLLNEAEHRQRCVVRIYRWSEPTLSVGYFQRNNLLNHLQETPFAKLPIVIRLSGGGAILHDYEWTYSCVIPNDQLPGSAPLKLYNTVHTRIVSLLNEWGIPAKLRKDFQQLDACRINPSRTNHSSQKFSTDVDSTQVETETFLCFLREDPRDIVCNFRKILGSAQRRRKGVVLQHGSLIWQQSALAPQIPGILNLIAMEKESDLTGTTFARELGRRIAETFTDHISERCFTHAEELLIQQLEPHCSLPM